LVSCFPGDGSTSDCMCIHGGEQSLFDKLPGQFAVFCFIPSSSKNQDLHNKPNAKVFRMKIQDKSLVTP
jgi:hypothetical protein